MCLRAGSASQSMEPATAGWCSRRHGHASCPPRPGHRVAAPSGGGVRGGAELRLHAAGRTRSARDRSVASQGRRDWGWFPRQRWRRSRGHHPGTGPSLDFTTTLSGVRWSVAIRDYGKSLTMTGPDATLTGRCLFVPGNFILRAADRGGHVLRAAPLARASALLPVQVGAPVWESPSASPRGKWLPVLVVEAHGLRLSAASGWLRQVGPYQGRAN